MILRLLLLLLVILEVCSLRILYVVTSSSGTNKDGSDRFNSTIIPVLQTSIQSMLSSNNYSVDLYLILSYELSDDRENNIRSVLPKSVGLEVWNDATPFYISEVKDKRRIRQIPKTLARQHRFVIKDKLFEYDFFVAMEDDMLVQGEQLQYHLRLSDKIKRLRAEAPYNTDILVPPGVKPADIFHGNLTKRQVSRLWPGFVRVEILQEGSDSQEVPDEIPVDLNGLSLNASVCCRMLDKPNPSNESLMIWETGVAGLSVREIPGLGWVALLQGPTYFPGTKDRIAGYYPYADFNLTRKPIAIPQSKYMAQTGGWMATRQQLLELHLDLCQGSFFPPYDDPYFWNDGLWGHNSGVESWSGGIQMWTQQSGCNMQRVLLLEDFSAALLYHTANNKQRTIKEHRRVLARNLLGQLNSLMKAAERAKNEQTRAPKDGKTNF